MLDNPETALEIEKKIKERIMEGSTQVKLARLALLIWTMMEMICSPTYWR